MRVSLLLRLNRECKPGPLFVGNKERCDWLAFDKTVTTLAKFFFDSTNERIFTCKVYNQNYCWIDNL